MYHCDRCKGPSFLGLRDYDQNAWLFYNNVRRKSYSNDMLPRISVQTHGNPQFTWVWPKETASPLWRFACWAKNHIWYKIRVQELAFFGRGEEKAVIHMGTSQTTWLWNGGGGFNNCTVIKFCMLQGREKGLHTVESSIKAWLKKRVLKPISFKSNAKKPSRH